MPFAAAPVPTVKEMSHKEGAAVKLVSTLSLNPFTVAVTTLTPADVLVRVASAIPDLFVTTGLVILAPLVATNSTAIPETGLPCASVITAWTLLAVSPSAGASSFRTDNSSCLAVMSSAVKANRALWLALLLTRVADTSK